jgi:ATP-dependent DNA ligase
MTTLVDILNALAYTNSPKDKVGILYSNRFNEDLKTIVKYALNPRITYGITWAVDHSTRLNAEYLTHKEIDLLELLSKRALTGNEAFEIVHKTINNSFKSSLPLILARDLRCGIGPAIVNEAWGKNFIPTFEVQLATTKKVHELQYPVYAETKFDGVRIVAVVQGNDAKFYTRNGNQVPLPNLAAFMKTHLPGVYDGELIYQAGLTDARTTISGMVNSAMHGGIIDETNVNFVMFDYLTLDEWHDQKCDRPFIDRMKALSFHAIPSRMVSVSVKQFISSVEELNAYYAQHINNGFEGLIVKAPNSRYMFKRSKDWVKFKEVNTVELLCTSIEEGTGKYLGMIGALNCEAKIDNKNIKVKLGSGLSDGQRKMPADCFVGHLIEAKYNTLIRDAKTGQWSLFLPRFVKVRGDL